MTRFTYLRITRDLLSDTDVALRRMSRGYVESLVLWTGAWTEPVSSVMTLHVPPQRALRSHAGLSVSVGAQALNDLNRWLFAHSQTVLAQIHTHPAEAYHSVTDSTFPIATREGSISIVVPNFARHGIRGPGVVAYRLEAGAWVKTPGHPAGSLIEVI